jgi:hypothetical protein
MGFILIIYIKFIGVEQYYQQYLSYMYVVTVNFNGGIGAGSQSSRRKPTDMPKSNRQIL